MPDERLSKNERRDAAREQARLAREKQKRQERLRRWLIPTGVTVVVVAIVAVVALVVSTSAPAAQTSAGPKNMISDGLLLTGSGGTMVATTTAALKAGQTPTPNPTPTADKVAHITTYVDLSCPVCQGFEATNAATIKSLVEQGAATIEIHPVAILDRNSLGARYSSRSANLAACVANFAPDNFYAVLEAMYVNQAAEGTTGLSDTQMLSIVHDAGLKNADVDSCVRGETYKSWVAAATARVIADPTLVNPSSGGFGTPTVLVNGKMYTGSPTDANAFTSFIQQVLAS